MPFAQDKKNIIYFLVKYSPLCMCMYKYVNELTAYVST